MSKTVFYTATTLDGFLADDDDSLDWLLTQPIDEDGPFSYGEFIATIGAIAMGSTTYEWVLAHNDRTGDAWAYEQPSWVFTHRDLRVVADNVRLTSAPVAEVHAELVAAADGKDVWMVGGGDLAAQFAEAGLLDEVVVSIAPVTVGSGKPLFPRRFDLELLEVDRNRAFIGARYRVVGPRLPPG
jgi:dihydrofolate reductase